MRKLPLLLITLVLLQGCVPKHEFVKTEFDGIKPQIDDVMIVIDFTSLKDDVGKLWDFDEEYNLNFQDEIYHQAKKALENKGYNVINQYLMSSGIFISRDYQAEHYKNGKLQENLISPPFIIRSVGLSDQDIDALSQLHYELNTVVTPQLKYNATNYRYSELNSKNILQALNLDNNTALLVISANRPRISAMKNIGIGLLSAGLVAGASGGAVIGVTTLQGVPSTFGYFVHKGTGDILWTNFAARVNFSSNNSSYFKSIPPAHDF